MVDSGTYSQKEMFDLLRPFISAPNIVSKLCAVAGADKRHVNLKLMAAMRRVFGVSIDELLDECFQYLPDREPPKK